MTIKILALFYMCYLVLFEISECNRNITSDSLISFLNRDSLISPCILLSAAYFPIAYPAFPAISSPRSGIPRLTRARLSGCWRNSRTVAAAECRSRIPVKSNQRMTNASFTEVLESKLRRLLYTRVSAST